ncbi:MAG: hypothetical protein ACTMKV_07740 [Sphingomonas parapaucimobilis]
MDHVIRIYAGRYRPDHAHHFGNAEYLGGVYGALPRGYAITVEVPDELLSPAGRNLVRLMDADFTGGPIRIKPQAIVRRRRVSVVEAAKALGRPMAVAQILMDVYGQESVGEEIVDEYLSDLALPVDHLGTRLARSINRLASRPGLYVKTGGSMYPVDPHSVAVDETKQYHRWTHMLDRAAMGMCA